ncbi:hypothetical protein QBC39DRAFT_436129 [Podospora conica]|nr:hypothetical protein QBC39DRAFT_436129 [Schizothecium conicum]
MSGADQQREQSRQQLLLALNSHPLHRDDDDDDSQTTTADGPRPRATPSDIAVTRWNELLATFDPPAHPNHDLHLDPVIWALRNLDPAILAFIASILHSDKVNALDDKTAARLKQLAASLDLAHDVVFLCFSSHPLDFLSVTPCQHLRKLSRHGEFDFVDFLTRVQQRFNRDVRSHEPEFRQQRFVLKLMREVACEIDPAVFKSKAKRKRTSSSSSSSAPTGSPPLASDGSPAPSPPPSEAASFSTQFSPEYQEDFVENNSAAGYDMEDSGICMDTESAVDLTSPDSTKSPRHNKKRRLEIPSPEPEYRLEAAMPLALAPIQGTHTSAEHLACLDTQDELDTGTKFLNDIVVNNALSNLVRWVMGTNSRTLAVDSLLPEAQALSARRRAEITADFSDHDALYIPTCDRSLEHWLLYRAVRDPIPPSAAATAAAKWSLERYDSLGQNQDDNDKRVRAFLARFGVHCAAVEEMQCPTQENEFDCGVYVVAMAEALLHNVPVLFGPLDPTVSRQKLRRNLAGHPDDAPELLVVADRLDMTRDFIRNHQHHVKTLAGMSRFDLSRSLLERQEDIQRAKMRYWQLCWVREEMCGRLSRSRPAPARPQRTPDQETFFQLTRFMDKCRQTAPTAVGTLVQGSGSTMLAYMAGLDDIRPAYNRAEMHERALEQVVWMVLRKKAGEEAVKASASLRAIRAYLSGFPGPVSSKVAGRF